MSARAARAVFVLALAALLAGCGSGAGDGARETTGGGPATAPGAAQVVVYFSDDAGRLVPERREGPAGASPLVAAMEALAAGPRDPGLLPALPPGTRVLSARAADGLATVDLSREFESGYPPGGAAAELAVVAPIVHSAARLPGIDRVVVTVDGRPPALTGSQIDFGTPLAPPDFPVEVAPGP